MKSLVLFFAISVSMILTSCSQLDEQTSPLGPTMNKQSKNSPTQPYTYLATFPELNSVKWSLSNNDDGNVVVSFISPVKNYSHLFCIVSYADIFEPALPNYELYFVGKPKSNEFNFQVPANKVISNIRVYVVYNYGGSRLPYADMQKFNSVPVNQWYAKGETISVDAANDINFNEHLFVRIESLSGSFLVFVGKPASSNFDIPKYGDMNVERLDLYGFSTFRSGDSF